MDKAKILIESGPAIGSNKSGIGYYVFHLLQSMAKNNVVYGYYFNFLSRHSNKLPVNVVPVAIKLIPGKIISVFKKVGRLPYIELFVLKKYDFILYTNYVAFPSLGKTPYGLVIYDLGFIDHPEYVQDKNLAYLRKFSPKSIENASLIVTISNFSKQRIEDVFPSTKGKIIVTYIPPVNNLSANNASVANLAKMGIKGKYILFVGSIEPRKNIQNLVEAYTKLPNTIKDSYSLVLAGGKGWKDEQILASIKEAKNNGNKIIQTGYITEAEKDALYKESSLFVLPSHYEGFGMPIYEAMQYKIPIVASNIPVFNEIAGNSITYFDKDSVGDIVNVIEKIISSKSLQKKQIDTYKERLSKYSWNKNSKIITDEIEKIIIKGRL